MHCSHLALAALGIFLLSQFMAGAVNISVPSGPPDTRGADSTESKLAMKKLVSIIIPKVDFENLDIAAIVDFLRIKSKELDSKHAGVQFRLALPPQLGPKSFSLQRKASITLQDVPLSELLGFVCVQTHLSYKIIKGVVVLYPDESTAPAAPIHSQ
jgi:hypothetical protein